MKFQWTALMAALLLLILATGSNGAGIDVDDYSTDLDYAQVTYVEAVQSSDGSWCFSTTVHHHDEGWDHYANAWQILDESGNELGWRLLAHPHDDEQPFTREQCDVEIPEQLSRIIVRAKCKVHGFGGQPVVVDLSGSDGDRYKVIRHNP